MRKGFISIYTLFILLILSLTITFIYNQQINTSEYARTLYNKKRAQYLAESIVNSYMQKNSSQVAKLIINDADDNPMDSFNKTKQIKSERYQYLNKAYTIKISRIYHGSRKELSGLYRVYCSDIVIEDSKASYYLYIKVYDKLETNNQMYDKNRLKIVIRQAF